MTDNNTTTTNSETQSASESRIRTRTRVRRAPIAPSEEATPAQPAPEPEARAENPEPAQQIPAKAAAKVAAKKKAPQTPTPQVPADSPPAADAGDDEVHRRIVRTRTRRPLVADPFTVTIAQPPPAAEVQPGAAEGQAVAQSETEDSDAVLRRRLRRRTGAATQAPETAPAAEPEASEAESQKGGRTRRRTRARRSRQDADQVSQVQADAAQPDAAQPESDQAQVKQDSKRAAAKAESPALPDASAPTRLQARARRGGRPSGRAVRGRGGRRVLGGVSEETRRAITEGPPRRMLVSVGEERTQIAVLEERVLMEHYVTHRRETSYVGNIYLGRVQNVLPGMEAAFIDIGKGRNGVLYAGEVNYDESDLDGDLPRIEQTLKQGQAVLVQVTKDPMGTKGARLTQHLSIAGRYCVLAPGDGMLGISRKLTDEERERLRKILRTIKPEEYGLIVRTAAEGATAEQLEADVARLVRIWEQVEQRAGKAKPLDAVYEEPDLVIRVIRDIFGSEFTELVVDSEELGQQVRDYLQDVSPELVDRASVYSGEQNILDAYEVTNQVRRALEKKVWLKSGGYLIVEKTEAMWIIDVNTGKFVGERNLEETVLRNNIEAATEIARQLRLRDMGGIIVIDFVDMLLPANREEVLKRFKRELARDKTKSRVMEISKLGLVQMTRKNVSQGLQESFTIRCDECEGRGHRMIVDILT